MHKYISHLREYLNLLRMTKVLFFMIVCTFTLPLNSVASELQKQPLTILSGQWAPYVGEALPSYGFISQIVTAAFETIEQPISLSLIHI